MNYPSELQQKMVAASQQNQCLGSGLPIVSASAPQKRGTQQQPLTAWHYPGAGISMAQQQQRAACKARNVKRHKRSVRG